MSFSLEVKIIRDKMRDINNCTFNELSSTESRDGIDYHIFDDEDNDDNDTCLLSTTEDNINS